MNLEPLDPAVRIVASFICAPELFDSDMGIHMIVQMSFSHEGLSALPLRTREGSLLYLYIP